MSRLLAAVAVLFLVTAIFTWAVSVHATDRWDEAILSWLRQHDQLPRDELVQSLTALGSTAVVSVISAAAGGLLLALKWYRSLACLLVAMIGLGLLNSLLEVGVGRVRPDGAGRFAGQTDSFPSGHAMMSTTLFLTLALIAARRIGCPTGKAYILACAVAASVLVGLSRVLLGVHYPTDVAAGWSAGAGWSLLSYSLLLGRGSD